MMMPGSRRFELVPRGPFALDTIRTFACGLFTASRACRADREVALAFGRDSDGAVVGARIAFDGRAVEVHAFGPETDLGPQVARILGLDHDASGFVAIGARDPVIGTLLAARPGFRPVVFFSPYAAAGWSVLSQRLRMGQAAAIARSLAVDGGDVVDVGGEVLASFPRPETILARRSHPSISQEKLRRLHAVARAALDGELRLERLRAEPVEVARERLLAIHGVGPWTAEAILTRGVGPTDALPLVEPMLRAAVGWAYGVPALPSEAAVHAIAEAWRPYRMWTSILLVMSFAQARAAGDPRAGAFGVPRGDGARRAAARA